MRTLRGMGEYRHGACIGMTAELVAIACVFVVSPARLSIADVYAPAMPMFHVSSVQNRSSIHRHGLDASRMGAAPGIAGSSRPEADGIFLCEVYMVDLFVGMNNTGGPVDVWQVEDVEAGQMLDNGNGFYYLPGSIPVDRIALVQQDLVGGHFPGA